MPIYTYSVRNAKTGESTKGTMSAESELDLADKLRASGCILIKAEVKQKEGKAIVKSGKLNPKELITFTLHLSTFLDAGIPLLEALSDLTKTSGSEKMTGVVSDIYQRIKGGSSLSEALVVNSKSFSKLYIALVKAGEGTGNLDTALASLASYLEWQQDLISKVKEAATYPVVLSCAMIGIIALLVGKVIPTFKPLFEEVGAALPLSTQIVLGVSGVFQRFWYIVILTAIGLFLLLRMYYKSKQGMYVIDSLKLKIPLFGGLIRKVSLSRFAHTLSLSLNSGVTILEALETSGETVGNAKLSKVIEAAKKSVNVGEELAGALEVSGEFPPLVIRMINVGEKSGSLVKGLNKVSQFYDKEVPSVIKRIFTLMEPIMIIVIGAVVGGIALSIFLPLFMIAQTIGG